MNIRITDLLDDYYDDFVTLPPPEQVLSSASGSTKSAPHPPKEKHRMKKLLAVAAALLLAVSGLFAGALRLGYGGAGSGGSAAPGSASPPAVTQWGSPIESSAQEDIPSEIQPDDTDAAIVPHAQLSDSNSQILTTPTNGFLIRVPDEFLENYRITTNNSFTLSVCPDAPMEQLVFLAADPSGTYDGFLWAITQTSLPDYQQAQSTSSAAQKAIYMQNARALGQKDDIVYSLIYLGYDYTLLQFDPSDLISTQAYIDRMEYAAVMLESFISLNDLSPIDDATGDWKTDLIQQVITPLQELSAQLAYQYQEAYTGDSPLTAQLGLTMEFGGSSLTVGSLVYHTATGEYDWILDSPALTDALPLGISDSQELLSASNETFSSLFMDLDQAFYTAYYHDAWLCFPNGTRSALGFGGHVSYSSETGQFTVRLSSMDDTGAVPTSVQILGETYPLTPAAE